MGHIILSGEVNQLLEGFLPGIHLYHTDSVQDLSEE